MRRSHLVWANWNNREIISKKVTCISYLNIHVCGQLSNIFWILNGDISSVDNDNYVVWETIDSLLKFVGF